uniref:O-phosphoseryl-tRNA(Sec) selenium transferase n=1 Tax=Romanomermis culicivorax TaxID=13658 RepID=A0A915JYK6_ROMCU
MNQHSSVILSSTLLLAEEAKASRENLMKQLLRQKQIPMHSWDDLQIRYLFTYLSALDSNNFPNHTGVGEREGRVFSQIVKERHFYLSHGIGRSGDIKSSQPKATGSSIVSQLANAMALHAIHLSGIRNAKECVVVPCSTGMALTLCMLNFRRQKPAASHVLWSRIDQKSCFKSILAAGYTPQILQLKIDDNNDQLKMTLEDLEVAIENLGVPNILCVMTTTSCFAPRIPDDIINVAKICKRLNVFHLVNNAYGLQCDKICNIVEEASRVGRVDAFVQSTDKNFMVPVGATIIGSFERSIIDSIAQLYPGRASASPLIDLVITLLSMGQDGYLELRKKRKTLFDDFKQKLSILAAKYDEKVLSTPKNTISMAMTLSKLDSALKSAEITKLGSMLFTRQCSGARVVVKGQGKLIEGIIFEGWMSHYPNYTCSYLNVAVAIGLESREIDRFLKILEDCLCKIYSRSSE